MSKIQQAWELLMVTYYDNARSASLNKSNLLELLKKEYPGEPRDKAEAENLLRKLDADPDGVVTFEEFVAIVTDFDLMFN